MSEPTSTPTLIPIIGRVLAAAAAVVACFLLYRFARGFWTHYTRGGPAGRRLADRRPLFGRKKDVLYSRLGSLNGFDDEDEGYHDDSESAPSTPRPDRWSERPLPDKPLPPLPETDGS